MTVGIRSVIRFATINGRNAAVEFPVHHHSGITADRYFFPAENIRTSGEASIRSEPLEVSRSGSVAFRVAIARPGRDISGLGVVVPNERLFAVLRALIGPVG